MWELCTGEQPRRRNSPEVKFLEGLRDHLEADRSGAAWALSKTSVVHDINMSCRIKAAEFYHRTKVIFLWDFVSSNPLLHIRALWISRSYLPFLWLMFLDKCAEIACIV
jgi:hypothetical protein